MAARKAAATQPPPSAAESPMWGKPKRRSLQQRLPAALHLGLSSTLTMFLLAASYCLVYLLVSPSDPVKHYLLMGFNIALVTAPCLALPVLGSSVGVSAARITGALAGGWLFYGFYTVTDAWWALSLLLGAWAFLLVAAAEARLPLVRAAGPPALMAAFVVVVNFGSSSEALPATLTKTLAIAGTILLYTVVAMALVPHTATAEFLDDVRGAVAELHLALNLLALGDTPAAATTSTTTTTSNQPAAATKPSSNAGTGSKGMNCATASADAAAAGCSDVEAPAAEDPPPRPSHISSPPGSSDAAAAAASAAGGSDGVGPCLSSAAVLLRGAEGLLPATRKEQYLGHCGDTSCYVVAPVHLGAHEPFPLLEASRLLEAGRQVLRVLLLMADRPSPSPLVVASIPPQLAAAAPQLRHHLTTCLSAAVAALQDISRALPPGRRVLGPQQRTIARPALATLQDSLVQLVAAGLTAHSAHLEQQQQQQQHTSTHQQPSTLQQQDGSKTDKKPSNRWHTAAAAAATKPSITAEMIPEAAAGQEAATTTTTAAAAAPTLGQQPSGASKDGAAAPATKPSITGEVIPEAAAGQEAATTTTTAAAAAPTLRQQPSGASKDGAAAPATKPSITAAAHIQQMFISSTRAAAASKPKAQLTAWYGGLLLLRQLLRSLTALADTAEALLVALPPVQREQQRQRSSSSSSAEQQQHSEVC